MLRPWKDISVAFKLYMLVGGEGLWSKAEKTSIIALQKYTETGRERDFEEFNRAMQVSLGDRQARVEMTKATPDYSRINEGFLQGHVHPDDIPGVVRLVRRFYW